MKITLIRLSVILLFLGVLLTPSTGLAQSTSNTITADDDMRIEPEKGTKNFFLLSDEETEQGYAYLLKVRITPDTVAMIAQTSGQIPNLESLSEKDAVKIFGPGEAEMMTALAAAEKTCVRYRCKQIILEPRFLDIKKSAFTVTGTEPLGNPPVPTTTVIVNLPKIVVPSAKSQIAVWLPVGKDFRIRREFCSIDSENRIGCVIANQP